MSVELTTTAAPGDAVSAAFALHRAGDRRGAEAGYRLILRREPDNADALHLLGQLAHECGNHRDAELLMRRAIELMPGAADFHNNLGAMLARTGRPREAIGSLRRAIALKAEFPEAYNNLGAALESLGDGDAAADAYRRAVALRPGYAGAYGNLSAALEWLGRPEAATEVRRRRIEAAPDDPRAHSDLLTGMLYHAGDDAEAVLAESLRWAERHEKRFLGSGRGPVLQSAPSLTLPRNTGGGNKAASTHVAPAERVLRVGYVSPDFRAHPVARFFAPMLAYHDRRQFAITCYAHVAAADPVTERLKRHADTWRDIAAMDDDAAAELIRRDQIDILVDLCGHMPFNRLPLFARRPAPVQVTYLGYPGTTGMSSMDWRITDARHDPPGETERFHTERLARIEGGCWCYQPDDEAPAVNDLPALTEDRSLTLAARQRRTGRDGGHLTSPDRQGVEPMAEDRSLTLEEDRSLTLAEDRSLTLAEDHSLTLAARQGQPFTFVMFNRLVKVTPAIVRLWTRIVSATPNGRLMFLNELARLRSRTATTRPYGQRLNVK